MEVKGLDNCRLMLETRIEWLSESKLLKLNGWQDGKKTRTNKPWSK